MPTLTDPFEAFRRARQQEGYLKPAEERPTVYGNRIDKLLEEVESKIEVRAQPALASSPGNRLETLCSDMLRLFEAATPLRQERIIALAERFVATMERLGSESDDLRSSEAEVGARHDELMASVANQAAGPAPRSGR